MKSVSCFAEALKFLLLVAVGGLGLQGCSSSSTPATTTAAFSCSASAEGSGTTLSNLSVLILDGTGPFTLSIPGLGSLTTASTTYSYVGAFTAAADSSVSVTDTSDGATTSCTIYPTTGTTSTGNIQLVISPSTNVTPGTYITVTAQDVTGAVDPTFTFTQLIGQYGAIIVPISTSSAEITSTGYTSVTIVISEYAAGATTGATPIATTQVYLTFSSTGVSGSTGSTGVGSGSLDCELEVGNVCSVSGNTVTCPVDTAIPFEVVDANNSGDTLEVTLISPGESWGGCGNGQSPSYPVSASFSLGYCSTGTKAFSLTAQSLSTGYTCTTSATIVIE